MPSTAFRNVWCAVHEPCTRNWFHIVRNKPDIDIYRSIEEKKPDETRLLLLKIVFQQLGRSAYLPSAEHDENLVQSPIMSDEYPPSLQVHDPVLHYAYSRIGFPFHTTHARFHVL